jgi:hypothetical protein
MTTSRMTRSELLQELDREKELERKEHLGIAPLDQLLQIALSPAWTVELAERCNIIESLSGVVKAIRGSSLDVRELFRKLEQAEMLEVIHPFSLDEEIDLPLIYQMSGSGRAEVFEAWKARRNQFKEDGSYFEEGFRGVVEAAWSEGFEVKPLNEMIRLVGKRISSLEGKVMGVPNQVWRWAYLAAWADNASVVVDLFENKVETAYRDLNSGEILNWIEAARPLATLLSDIWLDTGLSLALARAERRVELLQRRRVDESHLGGYLRRQELVKAFEELMDGPDHLWALHYLGAGGVGKTMLMRDITVNLTGIGEIQPGIGDTPQDLRYIKKYSNAAIARIDFDYLSADYPRLAPGLLLWSFAQELRAYDIGKKANQLFDRCERLLDQLHHDALPKKRTAEYRLTKDRRFVEAVRIFINALRQLDRQIVLILDTCEELAKVQLGEDAAENIDETFRILRALHDGPDALYDDNFGGNLLQGIPGLRVIFSGRRLLSSGGYEWVCNDSKLPERSFLRLQEIRGFTEAEASKLVDGLGVPNALGEAVIKASMPEACNTYSIQYLNPIRRPQPESRCNPLQFRLLADWALEKQPPTSDEIKQAQSYRYIEYRIIRRLGDPTLEKLLPAVALLGHFDEPMLRAASDLSEYEFDSVFGRLQEQEWVTTIYLGRQENGRRLFKVADGIREQLWMYYEKNGNSLSKCQQKALTYIQNLTFTRPVEDLHWTDLSAAFRVMDHYLELAVQWWDACEARIRFERGWEQLFSLLAPLDEDLPQSNQLRPLIWATRASAMLHIKNERPEKLWKAIQEATHSTTEFQSLNQRARINLFICNMNSTSPSRELHSSKLNSMAKYFNHIPLAEVISPNFASTCIAACEALVEYSEIHFLSDHKDRINIQQFLPLKLIDNFVANLKSYNFSWMQEQSPTYPEKTTIRNLLAFAQMLEARIYRLQGLDKFALECAKLAMEQVPSDIYAWDGWADWLPPEDMAARVKLEYVRLVYPGLQGPEQTLQSIDILPKGSDNIEQERLLSAQLSLRLAMSPVTTSELKEIQIGKNYKALACFSHTYIPPLQWKVAEGLAINGLIGESLELIRKWPPDIFYSKRNESFLDDSLGLRLARRMRLGEEGDSYAFLIPKWQKRPVGYFHTTSWVGAITRCPMNCTFCFEDQSGSPYPLLWALESLPPSRSKEGNIYKQTSNEGIACYLHLLWQNYYGLRNLNENHLLKWQEELEITLNALDPNQKSLQFFRVQLALDCFEVRQLLQMQKGISIERRVPDISASKSNIELLKEIEFSIPVLTSELVDYWEHQVDSPHEALLTLIRVTSLLPDKWGKNQGAIDLMANKIGYQQAGEFSMEAGELLALRLPEAAARLLKLSEQFFINSRSPVGQLLAAIGIELANDNIYERRSGKVRDWESLYIKISPEVGLPSWEQIQQIVLRPEPSAFDGLMPREWRPMLMRLVYLLMRDEQRFRGGSNSSLKILSEWISEKYGRDTKTGHQLPVEWDKRLYLELKSRPDNAKVNIESSLQKKPTIDNTKKPFLARIDWFNVILIAVILGVLTLLIGAPMLLWRFLLGGWVSSIAKNGFLQIGLYFLGSLVTWVFLLILYQILLDFRSRLVSRGNLEIDIQEIDIQSKVFDISKHEYEVLRDERPLINRWKLTGGKLALWPLSIKKFVISDEEIPGKTSGLKPYDQLIKSNVPEKELKIINTLSKRLRRRRLSVEIRLDSKARGEAWEIIFRPSGTYKTPNDMHFAVVRSVGAERLRFANSLSKQTSVTLLTVESITAGVIKESWKGFDVNVLYDINENTPSKGLDSGQIIHLASQIEESLQGVAFQLSDSNVPITNSSLAKERLLLPRDLNGLFPKADFFIVGGELTQAYEKTGSSSQSTIFNQRTDSDRRSASLMRLFAAELAELGIPYVLVLPPLSAETTSKAVKMLANCFLKSASSNKNIDLNILLKIIQEIQERIYWDISRARTQATTEKDTWKEMAWEVCMDVCLYVARSKDDKK